MHTIAYLAFQEQNKERVLRLFVEACFAFAGVDGGNGAG